MSGRWHSFHSYVRFNIGILSSVVLVCTPYTVSANGWAFTDDFTSHRIGALHGQGGWSVTNYYGNAQNAVNIAPPDASLGKNYVEIANHDAMVVTHDITPTKKGVFQFRTRHNKSDLFYFYALTSDAGGQLLWSIQFTKNKGILLEQGRDQITLLADYNANQWYVFTIDFDSSRGAQGTFKIKIDNGTYREYPYVDSESDIFDFGQMVFGSDSDGSAVSAFSDIQSLPAAATTTLVAPLPPTTPTDPAITVEF